MCTAIMYHTKDHYFGRNLDYETTFGETVVGMPRRYELRYKCMKEGAVSCNEHFAMLGMAVLVDGYPLYFDAVNEKGIAMAGLHFVGNAYYAPSEQVCEMEDIAPYELIPWVLSQCENMEQVRKLLQKTRLVALPFSEEFPLSPLHFMIADKEKSIVVEPMSDGLHIYDNSVGVLTNNPPFPYHMANLCNYMNLTSEVAVNRFSGKFSLEAFSRGMGSVGLPGDVSSASRFVRAAFVLTNSVSGESEEESVHQFFHILGSVEQIRGCVRLTSDQYEITTYSCCCNLEKGIYYYRTYEDFAIRKVCMGDLDLEGRVCILPIRN